jgi:2-polyprenyl-6-hydroxyphenyl methylase/3-demethylubiquinone-9 3-methyltransferase
MVPVISAPSVGTAPGRRLRNDPARYDDLATEWGRPDGSFAMLQRIAAARAALVPPAGRGGTALVDLGCGAGLMAPHLRGKGYRHVGCARHGVDLRLRGIPQPCPIC